MQTLTIGPPGSPMTSPSDIHVILPADAAEAAPRRVLRSAADDGDAAIVVVRGAGDGPGSAERLAAPVREDRADAVFGGRHRVLGPGAGSFALPRKALAGLDLTEDWPEVGDEVAVRGAAAGGRVLTLDDDAPIAPARIGRTLRAKARWWRPVVWRRNRLARRRSPEDWDASDTELASTLDNLDAATNYADWIVS